MAANAVQTQAEPAATAPPTYTQPAASSQSHAADANKAASYDWASKWYPLAFEADLDPAKPHSIEVLGTQLVLWLDPATKAWVAQEDLCPHRLVPLSEGRINTRGRLECGCECAAALAAFAPAHAEPLLWVPCADHGWEFSASGKLERIPQACLHLGSQEAALSAANTCHA